MAKFTKLFYNGCQGLFMVAYPVESLDGGELGSEGRTGEVGLEISCNRS